MHHRRILIRTSICNSIHTPIATINSHSTKMWYRRIEIPFNVPTFSWNIDSTSHIINQFLDVLYKTKLKMNILRREVAIFVSVVIWRIKDTNTHSTYYIHIGLERVSFVCHKCCSMCSSKMRCIQVFDVCCCSGRTAYGRFSIETCGK